MFQAQQIADTAIKRSLAATQCIVEEHELKLRHMQEIHDTKLKHMTEAHEWAREEHYLRLELMRKKQTDF